MNVSGSGFLLSIASVFSAAVPPRPVGRDTK
jgi:hypothetical protein